MTDVMMVISTFPDIETARQIGTVLIERQLAACVNLVGGGESIYRWQGAVERNEEVLAIFKTRREVAGDLEEAIQELHPYEVPEIIRISPDGVSKPYEKWVMEEVSPQ
jgi:uncharacterized protein involved in tolerance to divalent cations